jgi:putative ABC transport system permease protein
MFINHLKVAIRNLLKNKVHSGINIFGLAVGFAASLVIFLFANNELTYDAFHKNAESIFQVYKERITPTGTQITRDTWVPLARELKRQYPSIIEATRFWTNTDWVQFRDRRFQENVAYVDPSFLKIFTFPLVQGDANSVFSDIHSVIISQPMVEKHFGDEDPIGKTITINYETVYTIRGVLEEIPQNSILQMDFLVLTESAPDYKEIVDSWRNSFLSTYIQLSQGASPAALEAQLPGFVTKIWDEELNKSMILRLTPLLGLYNELSDANTYAYILLAIACVILFIASINSMNLTTARSLERAREIGLRKVLGAFRHQLIKQFLNESLIISALALVVGIGLLEFFLPVFNSYYDISLKVDYLGNLLAGFAAIAVAAFTVSFQSLKAALTNLVKALRYE